MVVKHSADVQFTFMLLQISPGHQELHASQQLNTNANGIHRSIFRIVL
jgi:hypothetical protein